MKLKRPGQGRDELPDRHHGRRDRRDLRAADQGHPDRSRRCSGHRSTPQAARRRRRSSSTSRTRSSTAGTCSPARCSASIFGVDGACDAPRAAARRSTGSCCACPVIGRVLRKVVVARFTRTLGTLLSSGVPILDALDICAKTAGNRVVAGRHHVRAREDLRRSRHGRARSPRRKVFPSMVVQMIGVGEQTGAMDQMLRRSPTSTKKRSTPRSPA